jgi:hypothetical protein
MAQLRRRTMLLCGAVGVLAVGGGIAVSRVHKPSYPPLGPGPDLDNLPVAAIPAPTDEPVEVVYCAGWDAATRAPVSPMAESVARAQDAAGAQWAAVLFVGEVARAVVEVCWSAHYAELWHIDDAGRRYRGVSYRRWPDERLRLFHVRSWNYAGPDTPERDSDEPTFGARVSRDATAAINHIEIEAKQTDGTTLTVVREWPDWPEREQPPENLAVPAVGGWAGLAGMTGPMTVRSGPSVVPTRFPWRPPRPLQPRYVTEMVTDGARFRTKDGRVLTVRRVPAGTIRLPSGRVVVADPAWLDADSPPLAVAAPPGEYPVDVFQVTENGSPETAMTITCRLTVTDAPVTSWHLALLDGNHELALGDGEFFGNPVDGATLSLTDHTGATAYPRAEIEAVAGREDPYHTISAENTDLVIVPGWSDGSFPTWLGRGADGTLCCYVVDFFDSDMATAQPT